MAKKNEEKKIATDDRDALEVLKSIDASLKTIVEALPKRQTTVLGGNT